MDFGRIVQQFRDFWAGLSRPRRMGLTLAVVGTVLALGAFAYLSTSTSYRVLVHDVPLDEVAAMQKSLTTASIPNRLASNGNTIEVPEDVIAKARVALASDGLPSRGGKGFEIFDESSLMTTPFVSSVNYQRALQAELGRSISQIESVQSARVMVARPEPSPFPRDQRPPTASVVLKLKPGTLMSRTAASSIVSLVAHAVDGLKPENVTVVDAGGRLLSDPHAADRDKLPTAQLEYQEKLEKHLAAKAEQLLSQHLGPGRAVVQVTAEINFQKVKERQELYSADRVGIAERNFTATTTGGGSGRGPAGAVSNTSRVGAGGGSGGGGGSNSKQEQTDADYLIPRTIRELEDGMGAVTRLSVAAMVDLKPQTEGAKVITPEAAEEVIKRAVGFRTGRDEVVVSNVPLTGPIGPQEPDETLTQLQRVQAYVGLARNISLALAVVLVLGFVALLVLRRRKPAPVPEIPPARDAAEAEEERRKADLARLIELARTAPDRVAEIFRMLVGAPAR